MEAGPRWYGHRNWAIRKWLAHFWTAEPIRMSAMQKTTQRCIGQRFPRIWIRSWCCCKLDAIWVFKISTGTVHCMATFSPFFLISKRIKLLFVLFRHIACRNENTRIALFLLANGASLEVTNNADEAPYDCIPDENGPCGRAIFFNLQIRSITGFPKYTVVCQ